MKSAAPKSTATLAAEHHYNQVAAQYLKSKASEEDSGELTDLKEAIADMAYWEMAASGASDEIKAARERHGEALKALTRPDFVDA